MKLLLDENLSRRIVPLLQTDYSGSSRWPFFNWKR